MGLQPSFGAGGELHRRSARGSRDQGPADCCERLYNLSAILCTDMQARVLKVLHVGSCSRTSGWGSYLVVSRTIGYCRDSPKKVPLISVNPIFNLKSDLPVMDRCNYCMPVCFQNHDEALPVVPHSTPGAI